jgi:hypothetical protein
VQIHELVRKQHVSHLISILLDFAIVLQTVLESHMALTYAVFINTAVFRLQLLMLTRNRNICRSLKYLRSGSFIFAIFLVRVWNI